MKSYSEVARIVSSKAQCASLPCIDSPERVSTQLERQQVPSLSGANAGNVRRRADGVGGDNHRRIQNVRAVHPSPNKIAAAASSDKVVGAKKGIHTHAQAVGLQESGGDAEPASGNATERARPKGRGKKKRRVSSSRLRGIWDARGHLVRVSPYPVAETSRNNSQGAPPSAACKPISQAAPSAGDSAANSVVENHPIKPLLPPMSASPSRPCQPPPKPQVKSAVSSLMCQRGSANNPEGVFRNAPHRQCPRIYRPLDPLAPALSTEILPKMRAPCVSRHRSGSATSASLNGNLPQSLGVVSETPGVNKLRHASKRKQAKPKQVRRRSNFAGAPRQPASVQKRNPATKLMETSPRFQDEVEISRIKLSRLPVKDTNIGSGTDSLQSIVTNVENHIVNTAQSVPDEKPSSVLHSMRSLPTVSSSVTSHTQEVGTLLERSKDRRMESATELGSRLRRKAGVVEPAPDDDGGCLTAMLLEEAVARPEHQLDAIDAPSNAGACDSLAANMTREEAELSQAHDAARNIQEADLGGLVLAGGGRAELLYDSSEGLAAKGAQATIMFNESSLLAERKLVDACDALEVYGADGYDRRSPRVDLNVLQYKSDVNGIEGSSSEYSEDDGFDDFPFNFHELTRQPPARPQLVPRLVLPSKLVMEETLDTLFSGEWV